MLYHRKEVEQLDNSYINFNFLFYIFTRMKDQREMSEERYVTTNLEQVDKMDLWGFSISNLGSTYLLAHQFKNLTTPKVKQSTNSYELVAVAPTE